MKQAILRFDGGCKGNPGRMYGSYEVIIDGRVFCNEFRFELGHGTNNMAEFLALERGLKKFLMCVMGFRKAYDILVITDSTIVRNRLIKKNKIHKKKAWAERSAVMFEYANRCLELLNQFNSFDVKWEGRQSNVDTFGH